jgi:hypothetical protein
MAIVAPRRVFVDPDQEIESRKEMIELGIVTSARRRRFNFAKQKMSARIDIAGRLGFADFGKGVKLDIESMAKLIAEAEESSLCLAFEFGDLQVVEREFHVL